MTDLKDIYSTPLLELAADIPHSGRLPAPDATATAYSKLCGSTVTVDVMMEGDRIVDFGQTVKACLLGQSSASIVGRHVIGRTAGEMRAVGAAMRKMLKEGGPVPDNGWEELRLLEPVREYKARHASTLLVFDAVEDAVGQIESRKGRAC